MQVKIAEYERNYEYVIAQKTAIELTAAEAITQAQAAEELIAQQPLEAEAIAQLPTTVGQTNQGMNFLVTEFIRPNTQHLQSIEQLE